MQTSATVELRVLDERLRAWGTPRYHSDMAAGVDLLACLLEPLVLEPQAAAVLVPSVSPFTSGIRTSLGLSSRGRDSVTGKVSFWEI